MWKIKTVKPWPSESQNCNRKENQQLRVRRQIQLQVKIVCYDLLQARTKCRRTKYTSAGTPQGKHQVAGPAPSSLIHAVFHRGLSS